MTIATITRENLNLDTKHLTKEMSLQMEAVIY